jgi:hypothetical protein
MAVEPNHTQIISPIQSTTLAPLHVPRGVALLRLCNGQCRFPIGEDASVAGGYRFCAEATSAELVYCTRHQRIAIAGPKKTRGGKVSTGNLKTRKIPA